MHYANLAVATPNVCSLLYIETLDEARDLRVAFRKMPYGFTEWEYESEPEPSSSRMGSPPRKVTGIDILDKLPIAGHHGPADLVTAGPYK